MDTEIKIEFQKLHKEFARFDKRLDDFERKFASKDDLKALEGRMDKKFVTKDDLVALESRIDQKFMTKDDLEKCLSGLEVRLKDYTDQQTETLAAMIQRSIVEPLESHLEENARETDFMKAWRAFRDK